MLLCEAALGARNKTKGFVQAEISLTVLGENLVSRLVHKKLKHTQRNVTTTGTERNHIESRLGGRSQLAQLRKVSHSLLLLFFTYQS